MEVHVIHKELLAMNSAKVTAWEDKKRTAGLGKILVNRRFDFQAKTSTKDKTTNR